MTTVDLGRDDISIFDLPVSITLRPGTPESQDDRTIVGTFSFQPALSTDDGVVNAKDSLAVSAVLANDEFDDLWYRLRADKNVPVGIQINAAGVEHEGFIGRTTWNIDETKVLPLRSVLLIYGGPSVALGGGREPFPAPFAVYQQRAKEWLKVNAIPEAAVGYRQLSRIQKDFANGAARRAYELGEDDHGTIRLLDEAGGLVAGLEDAFQLPERTPAMIEGIDRYRDTSRPDQAGNSRSAELLWYHRNPLFAFQEGYDSEARGYVNRMYLRDVATAYCSRRWLSCPLLEWIIVDALVFDEVAEFGEFLKQKQSGILSRLGVDLAYLAAKGRVASLVWQRLKYGTISTLVKLAVFVLLPAALTWWLWTEGHEQWAFWGAVIYFPLLAIRSVIRLIRRRFGTERSDINQQLKLWQTMCAAYRALIRDPISPRAVRDLLFQVAEKGAIFESAVFAILERAVERDPVIWGPSHRR